MIPILVSIPFGCPCDPARFIHQTIASASAKSAFELSRSSQQKLSSNIVLIEITRGVPMCFSKETGAKGYFDFICCSYAVIISIMQWFIISTQVCQPWSALKEDSWHWMELWLTNHESHQERDLCHPGGTGQVTTRPRPEGGHQLYI